MSIRKILGVLMLCVVFCATEYKKESLEQMSKAGGNIGKE